VPGLYTSLQRVLNVVDGLPVPERSADTARRYGSASTPPGSAAYTLDASHAVALGGSQRGICGADVTAFRRRPLLPGSQTAH